MNNLSIPVSKLYTLSFFKPFLVLIALVFSISLLFVSEASSQQRVSSCPYSADAMCEVCTKNKFAAGEIAVRTTMLPLE